MIKAVFDYLDRVEDAARRDPKSVPMRDILLAFGIHFALLAATMALVFVALPPLVYAIEQMYLWTDSLGRPLEQWLNDWWAYWLSN